MNINSLKRDILLCSFASNCYSEVDSTFTAAVAGLLLSVHQNVLWLNHDIFVKLLRQSQHKLPRDESLDADKVRRLCSHVPKRSKLTLAKTAATVSQSLPAQSDRSTTVLFNLGNSLSVKSLDLFLAADVRVYLTGVNRKAMMQSRRFLQACRLRWIELNYPEEFGRWHSSLADDQHCRRAYNLVEPSFLSREQEAEFAKKSKESLIHLLYLHSADEKIDQSKIDFFQQQHLHVFPGVRCVGPWPVDPQYATWFSILDELYNLTGWQVGLTFLQELQKRVSLLQRLEQNQRASGSARPPAQLYPCALIQDQLVLDLEMETAEPHS